MKTDYSKIRIHELFSTLDVSDIYLYASAQKQASSVLSVVRQKRTAYLNGRALTGENRRKHCRRMCKLVRIVADEDFVHTHTAFPCTCRAEVDIEIERLYVVHKAMLKKEQQKRWEISLRIGSPDKHLYKMMYRIGYWAVRKEQNDTAYQLFRKKKRIKAKKRYEANRTERREYARNWYHANRDRLLAQRRANAKTKRISLVAIPRPKRRKSEQDKKKEFKVKHTSVVLDFT